MILREWDDLRKIYQNSGAMRLLKTLYVPRNAFRFRALWLVTATYLVTPIVWAEVHGWASWLAVAVELLSIVGLYFCVEAATAALFCEEYAAHAIKDNSLKIRRYYLRYALFLNQLAEKGFTKRDITRLAKRVKAVTSAEPTFQRPAPYAQFVTAPAIALLVSIASAALQQSDLWHTGHQVPITVSIFYATLVLFMAVSTATPTRQEEREIGKFLEWASFDIVELREDTTG